MNPVYVAFLAITIYAIRHVEADRWNETNAKAYKDKIAILLEKYQTSRQTSGNVQLDWNAKATFLNGVEGYLDTADNLATYTKGIFNDMRQAFGTAYQDAQSIRDAVESFCKSINVHDDILADCKITIHYCKFTRLPQQSERIYYRCNSDYSTFNVDTPNSMAPKSLLRKNHYQRIFKTCHLLQGPCDTR